MPPKTGKNKKSSQAGPDPKEKAKRNFNDINEEFKSITSTNNKGM